MAGRFYQDFRRNIHQNSHLVDALTLRVLAAEVMAGVYYVGLTLGGWPAYSASRPVDPYWLNYRFGEWSVGKEGT